MSHIMWQKMQSPINQETQLQKEIEACESLEDVFCVLGSRMGTNRQYIDSYLLFDLSIYGLVLKGWLPKPFIDGMRQLTTKLHSGAEARELVAFAEVTLRKVAVKEHKGI